MGQFQVQPAKQLATQVRSMQRDIRTLQQLSAKSSPMGWTDLNAQLVNSWTELSGYPLLFEVEPGGNFVFLDGVLVVPGGASNPSQFATLGNATECIPFRNEVFSSVMITSTPTVVPVGILVDTSGNLSAYGAFSTGASLYVNGRYPLNAHV